MMPKLKPSSHLVPLGLLSIGIGLVFSGCAAGGSPAAEAPAPMSTTPPTLTAAVAPANIPAPAVSPTAATAPATALLPGAADTPMVEVPAGQFVMGIAPTTAARHYAEWWLYNTRETAFPPHYSGAIPRLTVSLPAFAVDKLQVTNADYRRCVAAGVCSSPAGRELGVPQDYFDVVAYADYPASVLWQQAVTYCAWLGKRLPTEAEWEKAARGTGGRRWPWGNEWDSRVLTSTTVGKLREIGLDPLNVSPYGVVDMLGNVGEWVSDWFDPTYYAVSPDRNPQGPAAPPAGALALKVLRSPNSSAVKWGLSARDRDVPELWDLGGVRCAYSAKQ